MSVAKVTRLAVKIVAVLAGMILALFLGWLGINLFDEDLTPAARALLTPPPNPYRSDDNIYIAIAGFDAPSRQSMIEAGQARIEAYNRALDFMLVDPDAAAAFGEKSTPSRLQFNGDAKPWSPLTSSIWSTTKARRNDVATLMAANQELYKRYIALRELHGYFETARPSYLAPIVYVPQPVRALFLADVAARIQAGTPQQGRAALTDLEQDLRLWKTMLKGNGSLLSKMLAAAGLHADVLLLGDLVADPGSDLTLLDGERQAVAVPFDVTDWKIGNVFGTEMRWMSPVYRTIPLANSPVVGSSARPANWWDRSWNVLQVQFFKLNATENLAAEQMGHLQALSDGDPASFSKARDEYHEWAGRRTSIKSLRTLYNPIGKTLVAIAAPAYEDYPMRVYDVAALQRLVVLAYQIRRQGIAREAVPAFMKLHPEWATHPIDATPFNWDPATGTLAVVTVGKQAEGRRFSVTLPTRASST
jgi:hypothetical protein